MTPLAHPARVVLLGCGGVGVSLLRQIIRLQQNTKPYVPVVAVADSNHIVVSETGFMDIACMEWIIKTKQSGAALDADTPTGVKVCEVEQGVDMLLSSAHPAFNYIFADCSASADTAAILVRAVASGNAAVTANKKPVSGSMETFKALTADARRFRCESTCGAGMPIIASIARIHRSGDGIRKMAGALSGTLGYVMSGLEAGTSFSAVVRDAKAQGFTEPDPRDDLSGMDVARKALICARMIGSNIELDEVKVESLYPKEFGPDHMSVDEFMAALPRLDKGVKSKIQMAASKGEVLRYAAVVENGSCSVGLVSVSKDSPLGRLSGTDNLFQLDSECYSPNPLVIQGRGAGTEATASGVLADLLELCDTMPASGAVGVRCSENDCISKAFFPFTT